MQLYIKQKVFSFTDKFSVLDEFGEEKYFVKGDMFSFSKKLHIYDKYENEIAVIRKKIFSMLSKYEIIIDKQIITTIVKDFSLFKPKYHIEGFGCKVLGSIFEHDYTVYDAYNQIIISVSKQWLSIRDVYAIEIVFPEYELLGLATALAIDCSLDS